MFCNSCGKEINDDAAVCVHCGVAVNNAKTASPAKADDNNMLWGLLGCCVPIAGLILFILWKDDKPMTAKTAGIGALVGFCLSIISSILMIVLMAFAGI